MMFDTSCKSATKKLPAGPLHRVAASIGMMICVPLVLAQAAQQPGSEEFGMSARDLVQAVETVEAEIEKCMRTQGFRYVAADFETVRRGMNSDKRLPGISEDEFVAKYGYGISTFYTGLAPQLENGYSPGKIGLGERNVAIFKSLSAADQVAYNRALLGQDTEATFAVALERENFSRTGGCTRKGIEKVFSSKQMESTYYNPKDDLINKDPRMKAALRKYATELRKAGFDYAHPDDVAPDITKRLLALTQDRTLRPEQMTSGQRKALKDLQDFERRVAKKSFELSEALFDPVERQIERERYARPVQ